MKNKFDIAVIGGGPAGMAAAKAASDAGASVVLIERERILGGILNQCIHSGFGLQYFKEELTGPEYAERFANLLNRQKIEIKLDSSVFEVKRTDNGFFVYVCSAAGIEELFAGGVVFAMGCRERGAGAINLCGERPSGIIAAGAAQKLINIEGYKVGKRAVIIGSGDIGLIMARRLTLEGAKVLAVFEIKETSGGLPRNIAQCLDDFSIPLYLSTTVTQIHGAKRVTGVTYAKVNENGEVIEGTQSYLDCDTVILSVGLIPETELALSLEVKHENGKLLVDGHKKLYSNGGICAYAAGNVLKVHDLVDNVTAEGLLAGKSAAESVLALNRGSK